MKYLSVCSGIEAATVAWHPLGWRPVAFSEVDRFPSAVLAHHYPDVLNRGDMTRFQEWDDAAFDVLVGGTPCQSFSVAGLRAGLDDPRGSLMLVYLAIARRYRPAWVVWENVPGVLSSDDGRAFGTFLGGLAGLGYGFAYRVLDAQYFRLAQRRRRVFVVGHLGDWRRAAAVLFERESLSGHPAPRRETREGLAGTLGGSSQSGGFRTTDLDNSGAFIPEIVPQAMSAKWAKGSSGPAGDEYANRVAHSLRADGFDASEDGTGRGTPLVPIAFSAKDYGADVGDIAPTLRAGGYVNSHANAGVMPAVVQAFYSTESRCDNLPPAGIAPPLKVGTNSGGSAPAVAFQEAQTGCREYDTAGTLRADGPGHDPVGTRVRSGMQVRRLTPRECERLQGFPDNYTLIPYRGKLAADGPRYKALGNSMAVPCMYWIGRRIQMVHDLCMEIDGGAVA